MCLEEAYMVINKPEICSGDSAHFALLLAQILKTLISFFGRCKFLPSYASIDSTQRKQADSPPRYHICVMVPLEKTLCGHSSSYLSIIWQVLTASKRVRTQDVLGATEKNYLAFERKECIFK